MPTRKLNRLDRLRQTLRIDVVDRIESPRPAETPKTVTVTGAQSRLSSGPKRSAVRLAKRKTA
jgi:hypothetical protein